MERLIYWVVLIIFIVFAVRQKKGYPFFLKLTLFLFAVGAILKVLSLTTPAEISMRLSLLSWGVGIVLVLIKLFHSLDTKNGPNAKNLSPDSLNTKSASSGV